MDHPSYHRPGNPYGDSYGAFGDNQVIAFEIPLAYCCFLRVYIKISV